MPKSFTRYLILLVSMPGLLVGPPASAEEPGAAQPPPAVAPPSAEAKRTEATLASLDSLFKLQGQLKADLKDLGKQLEAAKSAGEKKDIQAHIDKLDVDLQSTTRNLKEVAAGADIAGLRDSTDAVFDIKEEVFALLRPALKELKDMTAHVRLKSDLRDKIGYYRSKQPVAERAVANLQTLLDGRPDKALEKYLKGLLDDWQKQLTFLESELHSTELQLDKLEQGEQSLAAASQSYLKSFFRQRGLYLAQAVLAAAAVLLLSRLFYSLLVTVIPGYRSEHRSFQVRLFDLVYRVATLVLAILGPMFVFYLVEDWVLFSLGILLLLGIGLTLRHTLPRYWQQVQLFLNLGTVREGERLLLDGLPWKVRQINYYSVLENPVAELCQRIRIDELVDLKSRPIKPDEPWFPCKRGDWVLLSDGARGKVTAISEQMVQLVERGGAHRTYQTGDFLALSPNNLSRNFRIKETIGISYDLQSEAVAGIQETLRAHIERRAGDEGYGDQLHNLRVEFEKANSSSLDLVVIADFDGSLAELYGRLRRALQRWCVEACSANRWEIPFTQLTLHQA